MRWIFGLAIVMVLGVACSSDGGGPNDATETPTATPTIEFAVGTPTAAPTANGVRATVLGTMPFSAHDTSRSVFFVVVRFEPPLDNLASADAELLRGDTGELVGRLTPEAGASAGCVDSSGTGDVVFAFRGEKVEDLISDNTIFSRQLQLRLTFDGEPLLLDLPEPTCFATE